MDGVFDLGISGAARDAGDARSLLLDSAISHCEKLRRVLELEDWIRGARDSPLLARASVRWQAEREQLISELELPH
jgi:hypothetical protein